MSHGRFDTKRLSRRRQTSIRQPKLVTPEMPLGVCLHPAAPVDDCRGETTAKTNHRLHTQTGQTMPEAILSRV